MKPLASTTAWWCPTHGLIQFVWTDDDGRVCPINLSLDLGRITDDICQKPVEGPVVVNVMEEGE